MGELNMIRVDGFSCLNNKPDQVCYDIHWSITL